MTDPGDLAAVRTAPPFEAEVLAERLRAAGIEVTLPPASQLAAGLPGHDAKPVPVLVPADRLEEAAALLADPITGDDDAEPGEPQAGRHMPIAARLGLVVALVIVAASLVAAVVSLVL